MGPDLGIVDVRNSKYSTDDQGKHDIAKPFIDHCMADYRKHQIEGHTGVGPFLYLRPQVRNDQGRCPQHLTNGQRIGKVIGISQISGPAVEVSGANNSVPKGSIPKKRKMIPVAIQKMILFFFMIACFVMVLYLVLNH